MERFDSHTQNILDRKLYLEIEFLTPKVCVSSVECGDKKVSSFALFSDLLIDLCSLFYFRFNRVFHHQLLLNPCRVSFQKNVLFSVPQLLLDFL